MKKILHDSRSHPRLRQPDRKSTDENSGVDMLTLDQVKYRITYDAKQVNDTTQIPYIYRKAQMRLDIGSNITHFYNQSKEQWEQQKSYK